MQKRDVSLCFEAMSDLYVHLRHLFFLYKEQGDSKCMYDARRRWSELEFPAFGFYCLLHCDVPDGVVVDVSGLRDNYVNYLSDRYVKSERTSVAAHKCAMVRAEEVVYKRVLGSYDNLICNLVSDDELD